MNVCVEGKEKWVRERERDVQEQGRSSEGTTSRRPMRQGTRVGRRWWQGAFGETVEEGSEENKMREGRGVRQEEGERRGQDRER